MRWYVVQARPGAEAVAASRAKAEGFEAFFPRCWEARARAGSRPFPIRVALFPGYLFVRFDPAVPSWLVLQRGIGWARVLCDTAGRPQSVPRGGVESLQAAVQQEAVALPGWDAPLRAAAAPIPAGSSCRVLDGPFAGLLGSCKSSSGDRVRLLLTILGAEREVDVSRWALRVEA